MQFFKYGYKEIEYLKCRDKKFGAAIDRIGMIQREITPDPFTALISSIVSQQISKKAAETIWNRLSLLVGRITPENIARVGQDEIQSCGMSARKASYIQGIATAAILGVVNFDTLHMLSDKEIIKKLSKGR